MQTIQSTFYVFLVLVQFLILNQVAINTQLLTTPFGTMEWNSLEDNYLERLVCEISVPDIARLYKRSECEINERIIKLGLINKLVFNQKEFCSSESFTGRYNITKQKRWEVITDVVADFVVDLVDKIKEK